MASTGEISSTLKNDTLMKLTHMTWMRKPCGEFSASSSKPIPEEVAISAIPPEEFEECGDERENNLDTDEGDALDRNLILERRRNLVKSISKLFFRTIKPTCKNFKQFCFVDELSLRRAFDKVFSHHRRSVKKLDNQISIPNAKASETEGSRSLNAQAPVFRPLTPNFSPERLDDVCNGTEIDSHVTEPTSSDLTAVLSSASIRSNAREIRKRGYIVNRRPLSTNTPQVSSGSQCMNRLDSQSQLQEYLRATLNELDALRLNNFRSYDENTRTLFVESAEIGVRMTTDAPTLSVTSVSSAPIASCSLMNSSAQLMPIGVPHSTFSADKNPKMINSGLSSGTTITAIPSEVMRHSLLRPEQNCQFGHDDSQSNRYLKSAPDSNVNYAVVGMGPNCSAQCDRDSVKSTAQCQPHRAVDSLVSSSAAAHTNPPQTVFATGLRAISSCGISDKFIVSRSPVKNDTQFQRSVGANAADQNPFNSEQSATNSSCAYSHDTSTAVLPGQITSNPSRLPVTQMSDMTSLKSLPEPTSHPPKIIVKSNSQNISHCRAPLPESNYYDLHFAGKTNDASFQRALSTPMTSAPVLSFVDANRALTALNPDLYLQHFVVQNADAASTTTCTSTQSSRNISQVCRPKVPIISDEAFTPHSQGTFCETRVNETNNASNRVAPVILHSSSSAQYSSARTLQNTGVSPFGQNFVNQQRHRGTCSVTLENANSAPHSCVPVVNQWPTTLHQSDNSRMATAAYSAPTGISPLGSGDGNLTHLNSHNICPTVVRQTHHRSFFEP